jgi:adenylosuccinate lyase
MIQQLALKSYREGLDFKKLVLEDQNITSKLSNLEIVQLFDLNYYKRNIDMIYNQVFIDGE